MGEETEQPPCSLLLLSRLQVEKRASEMQLTFLRDSSLRLGKAIQWLKSSWLLISNSLPSHTSVKNPNETSLAYQDKETNKQTKNGINDVKM